MATDMEPTDVSLVLSRSQDSHELKRYGGKWSVAALPWTFNPNVGTLSHV